MIMATVATVATPNYQGCQTTRALLQPYCNTSLPIAARVESLITSLTLDEKVSRMYSCVDDCDTCPCAVDRVGLPEYAYLLEANTAVAAVCLAKEQCATVFPGPNGLAASFNRTMWRQKGIVLSTEVRAFQNHGGKRGLGKQTGLAVYGPNINLASEPRFGRNSELPGEDPFVAGAYAAEMVRGMQEVDAAGYPRSIAYLKHFVAYRREQDRGHDTYNISAFDFTDSYLPMYEVGMRADAGNASGLMCSYNAENGVPSCANGWLLNTVLRDQWSRPDAVVTTDSGAVQNLRGAPAFAPTDAAAAAWALNNGTDINDGHGFPALPDAIAQGLTHETTVDQALRRALTQLFAAGLFEPDPSTVSWTSIPANAINSSAHQAANMDAALQSFVLLRNENALLPLKRGMTIAVVGPQAEGRSSLLSDYATEEPCDDGTDECIVSIADAFRAINRAPRVTSATGVDINSDDASGIPAALKLAQAADVVVLALGIDKSVEGEGRDRPNVTLPGLQEDFGKQVLALGKPVLLVLVNGGAVAIDGLIHPPVTPPRAIIEAFNPNTIGASALASLVYGDANSWSKLPYTIYPSSYAAEQPTDNFDFAKSPGRTYRYYEGKPIFNFGFGLSYTPFGMKCQFSPAATNVTLGTFDCQVCNLGAIHGDEVVFLYQQPMENVRKFADHALPIKRLIGFERLSVGAGSATNVSFVVSKEMLKLASSDGSKVLYKGSYTMLLSRGHGEDVGFEVQI